MRSSFLKITGAVLAVAVVLVLVNLKTIQRLQRTVTLFDQENIQDNFLNLESYYPSRRIAKSERPIILPERKDYVLPESFPSEDTTLKVEDYLRYSQTNGLLVIHRDTIVYEQYFNGMTDTTTHISWSVAKSFVATLVGIAYHDGLIDDLADPITKYLPQFTGTGYDDVSIKDLLQMSSGVRFNEDYRDFNSDINRFGRVMALGTSFEKFARSLERERTPGTYNHYVSIDTQVLGMLVAKVTGQQLSAYLKEKIWDPLGMEHDAYWITDDTGMEMALGGLNVTLRDYARLGLLYLHEGTWQGRQIVPADWIRQSVTPDAPHLMPGDNPNSSNNFGYGFQWWIPERPAGDFFAAGIYNQYIYVNPPKDLVIVKLSSNYHFREPGDDSKIRHIDLFQAMARGFPVEEMQ